MGVKVEPAIEGREGWVRAGNGASHSAVVGGIISVRSKSRDPPPIMGVEMGSEPKT